MLGVTRIMKRMTPRPSILLVSNDVSIMKIPTTV